MARILCVIPAQAGILFGINFKIPACAGMTPGEDARQKSPTIGAFLVKCGWDKLHPTRPAGHPPLREGEELIWQIR